MILQARTTAPQGQMPIDQEARMVTVVAGPHRLTEAGEEAIGTGTERVTDHTVAIVEAEVDPEVHGGIDPHFMEVLRAEKSYWKDYRWIW